MADIKLIGLFVVIFFVVCMVILYYFLRKAFPSKKKEIRIYVDKKEESKQEIKNTPFEAPQKNGKKLSTEFLDEEMIKKMKNNVRIKYT